ncbi:heme ABC exporter ATP-binding protein CcmA [Sphingomonas qomolangmaensis]|uniref:Heme ABC exporter ATP-binding protein CcmA n=1 Tax=Sphingomonas qomolangmaensis TaxID=2918765 RepID=A0ABY5L3R6_9SPHN|nr:heme ABC exporter ATP-binding protein CcmA [Sphingomonas qomolangmaensis]UUL81605.1 heme ABC exporter ATP-binding protein CcmA [Sphingomonas qomolangmaensis]
MSLAFHDVSCTRGGRVLFAGLSFAIPPGEALAVRGPNGVGKSSLVRLAAGLVPPSAGRIERPERVALMHEGMALDHELPLAEALGFWAAIDGRADRVEAALGAVAMAELAEVPVRFLSTGQRRRAALARVIASDSALWLLDEPANGLDVAAVARLGEAIAVHRAGGGAVLVATHVPVALPDAREIVL